MIWYQLEGVIKDLLSRGYIPVVVNDPGYFVLKSAQAIGEIHAKVVIPMNQGNFLPERVVRKLLSEVDFDIDEFLGNIKTTNEPD